MAPQRPEDGSVRMPEHEFEAIPARAAEEGAKRALADLGLEGDEAALDIRDLRSLLDCIRIVRPDGDPDRSPDDHHRRDAGAARRDGGPLFGNTLADEGQ